jgi:hypothetical protein
MSAHNTAKSEVFYKPQTNELFTVVSYRDQDKRTVYILEGEHYAIRVKMKKIDGFTFFKSFVYVGDID